MIVNIKCAKAYLIVILLFSAIIFTGCYSVEERKKPIEQYRGQFTLFLNGPENPSSDISFSLSAVNIISAEGDSFEVTDLPLEINSMAVKGRQLLLGDRFLPEAAYSKLQLVVTRAVIKNKDRTASLALPPEGIEVPLDISIRRQQNISLFINWNADASVVDGYLFQPSIIVKKQVPELNTLLIYITNEGSDNVSVINKYSGEVVATIMVGKRPRGIAATLKGARSRIYVANSGSNSVSVIDPTINKIENEISLKFGREPEGIAVSAVSSGQDLVFVTNSGSNSVSVIDSLTFQETEKVDVGQGPVAVAVDPPMDVLVGTRYLSFEDINILRSYRERFFNVYVTNKRSNDVSVIIMDKTTNRSSEVFNLKTEWEPSAVTVDYRRGKVYIANYGSDRLSVIDIVKLVKGVRAGAVSSVSDVGDFLTGIIPDPVFDRLYLLREMPGEIIVTRPDFDASGSIMPPVMGVVAVGDLPGAFILGPENRMLYVVNSGADNISVVDKITRKVEQIISVGKKPYGIAIFQNLY